MRYISTRGDQTPRRFCEILEMHCRGAEAQSGAVFGALQAFEHLEAWILQRTAAPGTATA